MAGPFKRIAESGIDTALQSMWQLFGGMVWTAIGGAVIAGISALIIHLKGLDPVWTDRAITALLAFGTVAFVGIVQTIYRRYLSDRNARDARPKPQFIEVVNQSFQSQDILLDGYIYIGCTFTDVTFVYNNGETGGFDPTCKVGGNFGFKSRDAHIQQMLFFLQGLHFMRSPVQGRYTPILDEVSSPQFTSDGHSTVQQQRAITADQWSAMQAIFQSAYGSYSDIVVQIPRGNPEAKRYGQEFADFFQNVGAGGAKLYGGSPPIPDDFVGISIRYASRRPKPSTIDCLIRALKAAQIRHKVESIQLPPESESYCILAIGRNV